MTDSRNSVQGNVTNVVQARNIRGNITFSSRSDVLPNQLPPNSSAFIGRETVVSALVQSMAPGAGNAPIVLSGPPGVGKTETATYAARRSNENGSFSGGILFAALQDYSSKPVNLKSLLSRFICALGHPKSEVPLDEAELYGCYQTLLTAHAKTHGPVLILLDSALSAEQVRKLLPGDSRHRVVITSRYQLNLLDATHVNLDILTYEESEELLIRHLGLHRVKSDPANTRWIIDLCGRLPLALRIRAASLASPGDQSMQESAEALMPSETRLDELTYKDGASGTTLAVGHAFELSYRQLDQTQQKIFCFLTLDFTLVHSAEKVAALADVDLRTARKALHGLCHANLLQCTYPSGWYRLHDLLYLYAKHMLKSDDKNEFHGVAKARLLAYYVDSAGLASAMFIGSKSLVKSTFSNAADALTWFETELSGIYEAIQWAQGYKLYETASHLAIFVGYCLAFQERWDEAIRTIEIGLSLRRVAGVTDNEHKFVRIIAECYAKLGRKEDSDRYYRQAFEQAREFWDQSDESCYLMHRAGGLIGTGSNEDAVQLMNDALSAARLVGDHYNEAAALLELGVYHIDHGQPLDAIENLNHAAQIAKDHSGPWMQETIATKLGIAHLLNLDSSAAINQFEFAVECSIRSASLQGEWFARMALVTMYESVGRREEALAQVALSNAVKARLEKVENNHT